jgi:hypothetical protein
MLPGENRLNHDRVQDAACSQIPEASRAETHLRIGRLLVTQTPPEKRDGRGYSMGYSAELHAKSMADAVAFLQRQLMP